MYLRCWHGSAAREILGEIKGIFFTKNTKGISLGSVSGWDFRRAQEKATMQIKKARCLKTTDAAQPPECCVLMGEHFTKTNFKLSTQRKSQEIKSPTKDVPTETSRQLTPYSEICS